MCATATAISICATSWRSMAAPVLFDALEFDDSLATIDVLYDLAFLLMDLGKRGLRPHANAVLNAYLDGGDSSGNLLGLAALPFFLSLRAMIRAKVELLRARRGGGGHRGADTRRCPCLFRSCPRLPRAGAPAARRHWRVVGQRQIRRGPGHCGRHRRVPRRGACAQRRGAQALVRRGARLRGCRNAPMRRASRRRSTPCAASAPAGRSPPDGR